MQPEDFVTTNPVFALDELLVSSASGPARWVTQQACLDGIVTDLYRDGVALPSHALARWRSEGHLSSHSEPAPPLPQPGVVGLVHDRFSKRAFVVPITAKRAPGWSVGDTLPVTAEQLLGLLRRFLEVASGVSDTAFPEATGVTLTTPFPERVTGQSMDVAAVLAALDALRADRHPLLRAACAVVEVVGDAAGPVGAADVKLAAFVREIGTGSLLIRPRHCQHAAAFDASFSTVWAVESVADLAQHLLDAGLLDVYRSPSTLDHAATERLLTELHATAEVRHEHAATIALARRLLAASFDSHVPLRSRLRAREFLPAALRHLGLYEDALVEARQWAADVAGAGDAACFDDLARADLELAASSFDPGQFAEAIGVLRPWLDRIELEPRALDPRLRARIWNTAARTMVVAGTDGWRELFEASLCLQAKTEPREAQRTRNYLVHSLLRLGRLDDAHELLRAQATPSVDDAGRAWLSWYRADLARRRGTSWTDPDLDSSSPREGAANHALGSYFQATARQIGALAAQRFAKARACFLHDAERHGRCNVLWILVRAMELAEARARADHGAMRTALTDLRDSVTQPGLQAFRAYVADVLPTSETDSLEALLNRLPWM